MKKIALATMAAMFAVSGAYAQAPAPKADDKKAAPAAAKKDEAKKDAKKDEKKAEAKK